MPPDHRARSGANRYRLATRAIPRGETRSFLEVAADAGRAGAARAVGRALAACDRRSSIPWHRVISSSGALASDPHRKAEQLRRLRREGARPREGEGIQDWSRRVGARLVGNLADRTYARSRDPRVPIWNPLQVEKLRSHAAAQGRGFIHLDARQEVVAGAADEPVRHSRAPQPSLSRRLAQVDWDRTLDDLGREGAAHVPTFLHPDECRELRGLFGAAEHYERTIEMAPRGYGVGTYRYFREPLPSPAATLRRGLYARLRPLANAFRSGRPGERHYPATLERFWERCRRAGQRRGSSILLRYGRGGVNHPHRDIYGGEWFPFQAMVMLSRAGVDFRGGAFELWDERSGEQTARARIAATLGDLVLFCSHYRLQGRGRVPLRHGMARVVSGERFALGIVFHLAR